MSQWKQLSKGEIPETKNDSARVLVYTGRYVTILSYNSFHKCWDGEDEDDYFADLEDYDYWMELPNSPIIN